MSDDVQRLIRKLQPTGPRSFDEQSWPIYVAIVVLCGYLCGVVLSVLHFDDARIHANAFTWLIGITVAGGIGLWTVTLLRTSILRRTLVFSILLSLIVNLSLLVVLAWTSIFSKTWNETETKTVVEKKKQDVVIPEYPIFNEMDQQRVRQEYERPVETGEPDAEQRVELTRQSTQPEAQTAEFTPSESSTVADQETDLRPKRADAPSAPRHNEALAKLSRQPLKAAPNISRQSNAPDQAAKPKSSPTEVATSSQSTPLKQQTNDTPSHSMDSDQAPQKVDVAQFSRRSESESDTKVASLPTLKRQLRRPRELPKTSTPVEVELSQSKKVERSLDANSTLLAKRTTSAPDKQVNVSLQPKVASKLDRRTRMDRPETESLSRSLTRATLAKPSAKNIDVESPPIPVDQSTTETAKLSASSTSVAQRENQAPSRSRTNAPTAESDAQLKPSAQAVARAKAETRASVATQLAQRTSLTRANQLAQKTASASSEVQASVEAAFDSTTPSPASEPSRMAMSRSSVGTAGVGDASNLERGVAAPETPVNIASASANRASATQEMEQGPSLSPSMASLSRRLRADQRSPQTSMQAQPIDSAMVAGATVPANEAASSSASLRRAASNAPSADVTAAKGSSELDLGPTRVAADTGDGRAEGGGQPELVSGEQPRALPRKDTIAGKTGLRTTTDAPNATAPAAEDLAANENVAATAVGIDLAQTTEPLAASGGASLAGELTNAEAGDVRVAQAGGQRAEVDEDESSTSVAAGGNSSPERSSRSLQIRTATKSNVPSLAGAEASEGKRNGEPIDAQGARPRRSAPGLLVDNESDFGAAASQLEVDGSPDNLPAASFSRSSKSAADTGESLAITAQDRGATRRSRQRTISGSSTNVELDPEEFAVNEPETQQEDTLDGIGSSQFALATREPGGALMVDIDAMDGDGGLGDTPSIDSGIVSRNSSDASELVSMRPTRFLRRTRPGAAVATKTNVVSPTKAFRRRIVRRGEELAGERGLPSPKTEAAIELGLVFLSRYQSADGSWSLNNFADGKAELPDGEAAIMVSDTAATGLSLLSFLGAGYHHRADRYQEHVKNALDFLVQHQRDDGDLYIDQDTNSSRSAWLYSHAIATIALCEAYGMTQDPALKGPAQKAVNFIIEAQHPSRGGWRYSPAYGSDTSVSGWMTMAVKSAELAELDVPKSIYPKIEGWLDMAQASDAQPYLYRYNPYAPDTAKQRHGMKPTRTMTSVGLLMRLYTGWKRDNPNMILGARTLAQNLPELGTSSRPRRDTYYWYYATQVMFHMGGDYWTNWNEALHPLLTKSQIKSGDFTGSWSPLAPIPDRWGTYGGRLYVTNMNLLSLEVFYRHLPLYEDTSK